MDEKKSQHSRSSGRWREFRSGLRDGIPIGLGYLAVSFSLGITARNAGLNAFQGFLASMLTNASAGEYAVFTLIAANASYFEVFLVSLVANARYLLMSCALSQKLSPSVGLAHRFLTGFCITDEVFGVSVARPGFLDPVYTYGAFLPAWPCWATGTMLGVIAGNLLPVQAVSALSVALYGMFLAVIIPPARKNRVVAVLVVISFAASFAASILPWISTLADGTRTILLTVVISAVAALLFPVPNPEKEATEDDA